MLSNYSLSEDDDDESIEVDKLNKKDNSTLNICWQKQWEKQRLARRSFEKWQAQKDAEKARKVMKRLLSNIFTYAFILILLFW